MLKLNDRNIVFLSCLCCQKHQNDVNLVFLVFYRYLWKESSIGFEPVFPFVPPENSQKLEALWCFQGVWKGNNSLKWVNVKLWLLLWNLSCSVEKIWGTYEMHCAILYYLYNLYKGGKQLCRNVIFSNVAGFSLQACNFTKNNSAL